MKIDDIYLANSHFLSGKIELSGYAIKRKVFSNIAKQLSTKFIISLQGLRRVGKTVLLNQLVDYQVEAQKLSANNVLRYSFDLEDNIELLPSSELDDLLKLYFARILKINPRELKQHILIALDEIQNVANWSNVLKKYFDFSDKIKFVVTGSSALFLSENADSLAGRIIEYYIPCLDFEEYLAFKQSKEHWSFAANLESIPTLKNSPIPYDCVEEFENFLLLGGFPDTVLMENQGRTVAEIQDFIRKSIIGKIVRRDLKRYFNVANAQADYRLFELCCAESGSFFETSKIASEVGITAMSIKRHLDIFAQSSLAYPLNKFDRKLRREMKATKKLYVASPCLMFSMSYKQTCEDRAFVGHAAETYAFNKLMTYADRIYVYRGRQQQEEIDFYLPDKALLVEAKYSTKIDPRDFKFLLTQAKQLKVDHLVLTKDQHEYPGTLNSVPLLLI